MLDEETQALDKIDLVGSLMAFVDPINDKKDMGGRVKQTRGGLDNIEEEEVINCFVSSVMHSCCIMSSDKDHIYVCPSRLGRP